MVPALKKYTGLRKLNVARYVWSKEFQKEVV